MNLDLYTLHIGPASFLRAEVPSAWVLERTATAAEIRAANAEDESVLDALARLESGASRREVVGTNVLVPEGVCP